MTTTYPAGKFTVIHVGTCRRIVKRADRLTESDVRFCNLSIFDSVEEAQASELYVEVEETPPAFA